MTDFGRNHLASSCHAQKPALGSARRMRRTSVATSPVVAVMRHEARAALSGLSSQNSVSHSGIKSSSIALSSSDPLHQLTSPSGRVQRSHVRLDIEAELRKGRALPAVVLWRVASRKLSRVWPWCPADELPCATTTRANGCFISASAA